MLLKILTLFLLVAGLLYWIDSSRAKAIARAGGKQACAQAGVHFLDDTVVLNKIRLCHKKIGGIQLQRNYRFEFSSDGSIRYKGLIELIGKKIKNISMEVYRP